MSTAAPARKGVTAWEIEPMEENGDEFYVLTFHHGLGDMTRLDLSADDVREIGILLSTRRPLGWTRSTPIPATTDGSLT